MYNVTTNYKTYIKKSSRSFESKVVIGNRTFTNKDIIQIVPQSVQPQDRFSIGNVVSQSIDITLKNDGGVYASAGTVDVKIGLNINDTYEYIPIGLFNIDDVSKTDYTVKLTCYDNMIKFESAYISHLGNAPTLQQVVDELKSITGVDYDTTNWTIPNYTVTKLEGYTCREVLAYVASICGGNAYITRAGKFTVVIPKEVDCTITASNYIGSGYKVEDQTYKIGMITCKYKNSSGDTGSIDNADDETTISVGSLASNSMELLFENPWVTPTILNNIYNKIGGFSYLGYNLKWQGDLSLDAGDIITVIDKNNVTRKAYVYANKLTYTGGLTAETSAKGQTKNSNSFSYSGPSTKNIERISIKLLLAEKAIINKANIIDLDAANANIVNLQASVATINTALISLANIDNANITRLNAIDANISTLNTSVANINTALINKANVADLTATNANITNLTASVANIQTLINGNLTSANIQSLVLTSSKVTVDNGFIKNAMIESLDVSKINAGSLNTSKINISSSDGSLLIAGATQQFKDSSGKVRLQLGQDAQGNFNFILRSSDGTTTLIDGTGVKSNAIADKLIKNNMIADQAITSDKISYSSFVSGFNAGTNTNYINASKVNIDLTGQTMDVSFSNLNTKVDGIKTTTDNNVTSIGVIQGQIITLISNTTIIQNGVTTQLKDAYNGTVNTINSMQTTIGQHTSTLNTQTGQISNLSSQVTTIKANLDSISLELTNTSNTINNLVVGTRNYIFGSGFQNDIYANFWTLTSLYSLEEYDYNNFPYNALVCNNTTGGWSEISQEISALEGGKPYTFSAMVCGQMYIQITQVIYDEDTNSNEFIVTELLVDNTLFEKITKTITTNENVRYGYLNIATPHKSVSRIALLKLEQGTIATDWTPAPEDNDSSLAALKDYTNNSISTLSSSIKQTTDSIKLSVTNLQNTVNTINTTLGDKASTSSVTSVSNRTATLETNVSSISATVTSLQSTISTIQTTLNGKADTTTVTTISNSVANLQTSINGINASITSINTTTTSHTNSLNTVDSRIATAKSDAISTASTDATTKSNNAITNATANSKSYTDSQITTVNTSVTSLQSSISLLQNQIALKVEQSNINSAVTTLDGKITAQNTTISSLQSQINLQAGQISSKVEQSSFNSLLSNNLLSNSTGNYGTNKWTVNWLAAGTLKSTLASEVKYSYQSLKIANTDTGHQTYGSQRFVLKPNTTYTISLYLTCDSNLVGTDIYLLCRKKNSTNDWDYLSYQTLSPLTTGYTYLTWQYTTPSDVQDAYIRLDNNGTKTAGTTANVWFSRIKIEEGATATAWTASQADSVGTIITQSTTEVMTAFNNISSYFKVNADGATFGDTLTGDYTVLGANGLKHHVGGTDYDFLYITYVMDAPINVVVESFSYTGTKNLRGGNEMDAIQGHEFSYFIPYDATLKRMLNGRIPKYVERQNTSIIAPLQYPSTWTESGPYVEYGQNSTFKVSNEYGTTIGESCDANGITVKGTLYAYQNIEHYYSNGIYQNTTTKIVTGGSIGFRFLIFA